MTASNKRWTSRFNGRQRLPHFPPGAIPQYMRHSAHWKYVARSSSLRSLMPLSYILLFCPHPLPYLFVFMISTMIHPSLRRLLIILLSLVTSVASSAPLPSSPHLPDFLTASLAANFTPPVCRFASPHNLPDPTALLTNSTLRAQFVQSLLYWEGQFLQPSPCNTSCCHFEPPTEGVASYIGLHEPTMVTMDGHRLSIPSGTPLDGGAHMFTASSKESLHVGLLALALSSTPAAPLASLLLSPGSGGQRQAVMDVAVQQLAIKANSYDLFDCRFPGFGGFLPWVAVHDDGISPQPGWEVQVPALDNGQLIWAVYALLEVMENDEQLRSILHIPLNSTYCPSRTTAAHLAQHDAGGAVAGRAGPLAEQRADRLLRLSGPLPCRRLHT